MGYTHYWYRPVEGEPPEKVFGALLSMSMIIRSSPVPLAGPHGEGEPEINESGIWFNGRGEEDSHETFCFPVQPKHNEWDDQTDPLVFEFCKTARKPYDAVVVACLLAAKHHLGDLIQISSDGNWDEWQDGADDWRDKEAIPSGVDLFEQVMGWRPDNPLEPEEG